MDRRGSLFRGTELPRMLVLLAITIVGVVFLWRYIYLKKAGPLGPPPLLAEEAADPIKPDKSPEFEGVTDRSKVGLRDTAAFVKLLDRARETSASDLARASRRDVYFSHLWNNPKNYRGVPVHLLGTAFHITHEPSKHSKSGWLYHAWVVTPEGGSNPYVCVFEDAPKKLPIGDNLSERVVFNGYFLKILAYQARDKERGAPMLVGRIGWTPEPPPRDDRSYLLQFMLIAVGTAFVISFFRWFTAFRKTLSASKTPTLLADRPIEEISPEDLSNYLGRVAEEPEKSENEVPGSA